MVPPRGRRPRTSESPSGSVRPGARVRRNKEASTQSEVMGHTVRLACVSLNQSDWTTSAGRGFPEYAPLVAQVMEAVGATELLDYGAGKGRLGATLRVTKNTLAKVAASRAGAPQLEGMLAGPTAVAFCKGDPAAVAKKLSDLARETRILRLKGAVLDGAILDEEGVKRLATLPPKEALQAQFVGVLAGPLAGFVSVLGAAPREFVVVLDQIIQKKQAEAA